MAVEYFYGRIARGTSTERTGGTFTNLPAGWIFIESNTQAMYYWNGTSWLAMGGGGSGEANTYSNAGTGGVGVTLTKTGVDLPFKSINAGSSKITVTDDTTNKNVDIDVAEANLTLANLAGTLGYSKLSLSNSIVNADVSTTAAIAKSKLASLAIVNADVDAAAAIAWSKVSKTGSVLADIANVSLTSPAAGDKLAYDGTNWINSATPNVLFSGLWQSTDNSTSWATIHNPINAAFNQATSSEAGAQVPVPYNLILKRIIVKMQTNSLNSTCTMALRDDGADAASVTITAASTAVVDSGALNVAIAAGSNVNWRLTFAATSGAWRILYTHAWCLAY